MKKIASRIVYTLIATVVVFGISCEKESGYEREQREIREYLEENNITTEPTYSGMYYIERKKGTGASADGGDEVRVEYTGTFLNGEVFDSGVFTFIIGSGKVIKGWDEGISYMNEGGKATLLIPSDLAYGPYGKSTIPGYTPLLFDVALLDVL